uniref:Retrotransposon gag domain-containing protein n=1 Tax=Solanum lycopersicum TaxID=4081 RepID=K4AVA3_SOLLC
MTIFRAGGRTLMHDIVAEVSGGSDSIRKVIEADNFVPYSKPKMYHLYNERWYRQDQLLRSALIASLSTKVVSLVNADETSYGVWNNLCRMYAKPSRAQILSLKDSLTRATKGTQSMSAYLQHIKQLVTLNSTKTAITLDDVTLYVLNVLPS